MRKIELIGKTYGMLTVMSRADTKNGQIFYNCICECGNQAVVRGDLLRNGKTQSCGCKLKKSCEEFGDRVRKHWIVDGKEYGAYELCAYLGIPVASFYRKLKAHGGNLDELITELRSVPEDTEEK